MNVPLSVALVGVLVAAGTDLWNFRIHNALTVPFVLSGLTYHAMVGQGIGLSGGAWGVLAGTFPLLLLYAMGGMGAGDLKLMAGVGAWLGPIVALHVLIISCMATGCYSAWLLNRNRTRAAAALGERFARDPRPVGGACERTTEMALALNRSDRRSNAVPFGAMVALGVIVTALFD